MPFTETGETRGRQSVLFQMLSRSLSDPPAEMSGSSSGVELHREHWAQKTNLGAWTGWDCGTGLGGGVGSVTARKSVNQEVKALRFPEISTFNSHTGRTSFKPWGNSTFRCRVEIEKEEPAVGKKNRGIHHPRHQGKRHGQLAWLHLRNQIKSWKMFLILNNFEVTGDLRKKFQQNNGS